MDETVVATDRLTGRYGDRLAVDSVSLTVPAARSTASWAPTAQARPRRCGCCWVWYGRPAAVRACWARAHPGPGRPAAVGGTLVALATVVVGVVLGTAAGSLVGALGASGQAGADPGVLTVLPGSIAQAALATYLVAFIAAALLLVGHRDLA